VSRRCRSLLLAVTAISLAACTTYTQIGMGELPDHDRVRVTTTDGERHDVRQPHVEADSIKGVMGAGIVSVPDDPFAVPAAAVSTLEARHVSTSKTAALVIGVLALAFVVVVAAFEAADLQ